VPLCASHPVRGFDIAREILFIRYQISADVFDGLSTAARVKNSFYQSISHISLSLSLSLSLSVSLHQSRRFPDLDARRSWSIPISVNLLLFSLLNNALNNRSRVWPLERGSSVHFDTANRVRYRSPVSRESISVSFPLPRHHSNDISKALLPLSLSLSLSLFLCDPENLSNQTFKAK